MTAQVPPDDIEPAQIEIGQTEIGQIEIGQPGPFDPRPFDVVVIGGGIIGLAHAFHAATAGARVAVVERDVRAVGASIRNFGHICISVQSGALFEYASAGRADWLSLANKAGFWAAECGTVVLAQEADELAVLEDLAAGGERDVTLLSAAETRSRVPVACDLVGGALLPLDLRVDPLQAAAAIAHWLAEQGVTFFWSTSALSVEPNLVHTSRGTIRTERTIVAVGHDVDRLYPRIASEHGIRRCTLHMLQLRAANGIRVDPAVLTGYSMLRYSGFATSPALEAVRSRLRAADPDAIAADLNLMFTQRPNGDLVLGDTHEYAAVADPFCDESLDDLLLGYARRLLGDQFGVSKRWQGVYASAKEPYLLAAPSPQVRVVSVTTGVGMTISFGLAKQVIDDLFA